MHLLTYSPTLQSTPVSISIVLLFFVIIYSVSSYLPSFTSLSLQALRHTSRIPSHVAFIMDGNRRWATRANLPPHKGHPAGGEKLLECLQWCLDAGVRTVTVYAFSVENFKRSATEVAAILDLAKQKFDDFGSRAAIIHQRQVRVRVLGDLKLIPEDLRSAMATVMRDTSVYTDGPVLNICFAYAARRDMASAVSNVARLVKEEDLDPEDIDEKALEMCLASGYSKGGDENPPDLLVRTSGETRLSDFLLWECEQSILCFYPVLWPDLSAWDFLNILSEYQREYELRRQWAEQERPDLSSNLGRKGAMNVALEKERAKYFKEIELYCERISN